MRTGNGEVLHGPITIVFDEKGALHEGCSHFRPRKLFKGHPWRWWFRNCLIVRMLEKGVLISVVAILKQKGKENPQGKQ